MNNLRKDIRTRVVSGALLAMVLALCARDATAAVRYVDVNSTNPIPPHYSWSTAARTIQDAVDAAMPGDEIVVTNGVYQTGGRVAPDAMGTNRLAVTKAVSLRSVNGPAFTIIRGFNDPTTTNVHTWVRCVYLGAGASLSGFTLTNGGAAARGGGILCETNTALLFDCVIVGNRAPDSGGGVSGGTLNHCTLAENRAGTGGGADGSTLNHCTLTGNSAGWTYGDLVNLGSGGGAARSVLNSCIVSNNGTAEGGGVAWSTVHNSLIVRNGAGFGAGAIQSTLLNCTVANNYGGATHGKAGVGVSDCLATNCIIVDNWSEWEGLDNYLRSTLSYSCTSPMPATGLGNITDAALFVNASGGDFRLQPGSPGIDAGTDLDFMVTSDLAGVPRPLDGNQDGVAAFDMGAYEFAPLLNSVRYVNVSNTAPSPPFLTWATAATTIQDAVDAAIPGDEILVTNGVYHSGGTVASGSLETNRVTVTKPVAIRSVNGPGSTTIRGFIGELADRDNQIRCVYLGAGATLSGFTLTEGGTSDVGGGVFCQTNSSVLVNCVLVNNSAIGGGGAYGGTLINCLLNSNRAAFFGKGALSSILIGCTVVNNDGSPSHIVSGAIRDSIAINCIVINNRTRGGGFDNFVNSELSYSCTSPMPTTGVSNITNAPLFIDLAGGDFRLQPGSPCIDAGTNLSTILYNDLTGLPRPLDGNRDGIAGFDMGAYEFNPLFLTSISKVGANMRVCWFGNIPGMKLQACSTISRGIWSDVFVPPDTTCIELPLTSSNVFFRLSLP